MKRVRQPRGPQAQENNLIGAEGQIRADMTNFELRLHDASKVGGHRIPNIETVKALIASGAEGSVGSLRILQTEAELASLTPSANIIAVVRQAGQEESFVWAAGAGDAGDIASVIDGHWSRLDGMEGTIIRFWRAGLVKMDIDGIEPVNPPTLNKDKTLWLVDGVIKAYDGAAYQPMTPTLFARYLAVTGGYQVGSFDLPARLQDISVLLADADTFKLNGWARINSTTTHRPLDGEQFLECRMVSGTYGYQRVTITDGAGATYMRFLTAGVWGAWAYIPGGFTLPARLTLATPATLAAITETGFHKIAASGAGNPFGATAAVVYAIVDGTNASFIAINPTTGEMATANRIAGVDPATADAWIRVGSQVGNIEYSASNTVIPHRRMKANGALVSRTTYAVLFARIGTVFGVGDGATTFALPDLRGVFIRGYDDGRGIDVSRVFGSQQASSVGPHTHTATAAAVPNHTHTGTADSGGAHVHTGTAASAGAHTHTSPSAAGSAGAPQVTAVGNNNSTTGSITSSSAGAHTHTLTIDSGGAHTHTLSIAAAGGHTPIITVDASTGVDTYPINVALTALIVY